LNVLNDLNVWNIPERKACLRGETVSSCRFNNSESAHQSYSDDGEHGRKSIGCSPGLVCRLIVQAEIAKECR